ncbi:MAG: ribonuclease HII [Campylobacteraceae bacterium]|jgi:ribonuclease HII|nr:ribonuclease HII [Campylobacteraceae bacterium]
MLCAASFERKGSLCGIDEAGRGCLAGPLAVAGCVLKSNVEGLADSKILTFKKREKLFEQIIENSLYKILLFPHSEIDEKGLSFCLKEAILTIKKCFEKCEILMDGNCSFGVKGVKTMIKADAKVAEVSAASILAKVTRDRYMLEMDKLYPQWQFAKHKGYGSALHINMIKEFGISPIQRKSFKIKALEARLF